MPGDPERLGRAARATHISIDTGTLDALAEAARRVEEGPDAPGADAAASGTADGSAGGTYRVSDPRTPVDDRYR